MVVFNGRMPPSPAAKLLCYYARGSLGPAEENRGARLTASPNTKRGLSGVMTLEQACPPECQGAQCAFKDSMIH